MLPKLPRVKLAEIDRLHEDFIQLFNRFRSQVLTQELCQRLARNIQGALEGVKSTFAFQTLMQYEGRVLDSKWCNLLARQLVARRGELQVGVLQLFDRPVRDEWVAMEVYNVEECEWRDNRPGLLLSLACLTGHPAGHMLQKKFPEGWISFLAYKIAYTRRMQYDYDPKQLTGMRFWGYLLAARRDPGELDFDDWKVDARLKAGNQSILKLRTRFDVEPHKIPDGKEDEYSCPFGKETYCSQCSCSVRECIGSYNRERAYVDETVLDGEPSIH